MSFFGNLGGGNSSTTAGSTPSLFGQTTTKPGLNFGGSTAQPGQNSTGGTGLFGTPFGQSKPAGGLFGQSSSGSAGNPFLQVSSESTSHGQSSSQPAQNAFGQSSSQPPQGQSLGLFGTTIAQNQNQQANNALGQQQQQPRPLGQTLRFGHAESQQTIAQAQAAREPWWQEGRGMGVLKTTTQQMELMKDKWDPASLASPLRTYLYQHVGSESEALKYSPDPNLEDPSKWEEAVQTRPGPEWVPVLARGFEELANRGRLQSQVIRRCNMMLREINNSLDIQLDAHRQKVAARIDESKRRHKAISERTLKLAVKVQRLKNRGYVMDNAEEELKHKLEHLEKQVFDASIYAREQEIWARMLAIRERARHLKAEMENLEPAAQQDVNEPILDEDTLKQARKVSASPHTHKNMLTREQTLSAYDTQLKHLQKEMQLVQEEYADWEKLSKASGLQVP